jgi:hypothetical protein
MNDALAKRFGAYCAIMGDDVGAALVRNGWARPRSDAYAAEVAEARRNRAGLWNGDWTVEPAIGGVFRTHTSVRGLDSKATVASTLSVSGDMPRGGYAMKLP